MTQQLVPTVLPRRNARRRVRHTLAPLLWVGPALALIAVVVLWPVVVMFRTSFQHISPDGFVLGSAGGRNFSNLFDEPDLNGVLIRTVVWVVAVVVVTMLISMVLAQLFNARFAGPAGRPVGADRPVGRVGHDDRAHLPLGAGREQRSHQRLPARHRRALSPSTPTRPTGSAGPGPPWPG